MGKLQILVGDITSDEILEGHDCIVNPTNPRMVCGAGVSGAIFHKAGVNKLENYTQNRYDISYDTNDNLMKIGDIRITPGFDLGMDIVFVQGPTVWDYNAEERLFDVYRKMLEAINEKGYKNILLPSLGTGNYGFEPKDIGNKVRYVLSEFVKDKDVNIDLVLFFPEDKQYYI
jgi:O-acetyl-ADP-ribose deacetylase (regulator of RNase III)